NRNYASEISRCGDTVHITGLADPTIGSYTAPTDITMEDVDDTPQALVIDQAKYFAFEVDDIQPRQARDGGGVPRAHAAKAEDQLRDTAGQYVAGLMGAATAPGAEVTISNADEAYDLLVDLAVELDENNVPSEGRFVVVTPAFHGHLLKDNRFVATGDAAA